MPLADFSNVAITPEDAQQFRQAFGRLVSVPDSLRIVNELARKDENAYWSISLSLDAYPERVQLAKRLRHWNDAIQWLNRTQRLSLYADVPLSPDERDDARWDKLGALVEAALTLEAAAVEGIANLSLEAVADFRWLAQSDDEIDEELYDEICELIPKSVPKKLPAKIGKLKGGEKIVAVDGDEIKLRRDSKEDNEHPHMDFVEAGNDLEAKWVRREFGDNHLLVDANLEIHDWKFCLYHEAHERRCMARGQSYDTAHNHANACEKKLRQRDGKQQLGIQWLDWTRAQSQAGTVKAVWSGPGFRKPLYGADAEAALRAQQQKAAKPQPGMQGEKTFEKEFQKHFAPQKVDSVEARVQKAQQALMTVIGNQQAAGQPPIVSRGGNVAQPRPRLLTDQHIRDISAGLPHMNAKELLDLRDKLHHEKIDLVGPGSMRERVINSIIRSAKQHYIPRVYGEGEEPTGPGGTTSPAAAPTAGQIQKSGGVPARPSGPGGSPAPPEPTAPPLKSGPPAPEPKTGIINPKPTSPGSPIVSGVKEIPPEAKKPPVPSPERPPTSSQVSQRPHPPGVQPVLPRPKEPISIDTGGPAQAPPKLHPGQVPEATEPLHPALKVIDQTSGGDLENTAMILGVKVPPLAPARTYAERIRNQQAREDELRFQIKGKMIEQYNEKLNAREQEALKGQVPDQLEGGKADQVPPESIPQEKVAEGMKVETEHTSDPAKAAEIARDHLSEDPNYYEKLKQVEGGKQPETDAPMPDWMRGNMEKLAAAIPENVQNQIEELAAQRKTAAEIAKESGVDVESVRAVRLKRGIPSMTTGAGAAQQANPEFDAWLQKRKQAGEPNAAPQGQKQEGDRTEHQRNAPLGAQDVAVDRGGAEHGAEVGGAHPQEGQKQEVAPTEPPDEFARIEQRGKGRIQGLKAQSLGEGRFRVEIGKGKFVTGTREELAEPIRQRVEQRAIRAQKIKETIEADVPKAAKTESLLSHVMGRIDPDTLGIGTQEAIEGGFPISALRKGGSSLDEVAEDLAASGELVVPENMNASEFLRDQLSNGAASASADFDKYWSQEAERYYARQQELENARRELEQAGLGGEVEKVQGDVGSPEGFEGEDELRQGEEGAAPEDRESAAGGENIDFPFGANEPAAAAGEQPASVEPPAPEQPELQPEAGKTDLFAQPLPKTFGGGPKPQQTGLPFGSAQSKGPSAAAFDAVNDQFGKENVQNRDASGRALVNGIWYQPWFDKEADDWKFAEVGDAENGLDPEKVDAVPGAEEAPMPEGGEGLFAPGEVAGEGQAQSAKVGDTKSGWVIKNVLPAWGEHQEINRGVRRTQPGRGELILAEHPTEGAGEFTQEDWNQIGSAQAQPSAPEQPAERWNVPKGQPAPKGLSKEEKLKLMEARVARGEHPMHPQDPTELPIKPPEAFESLEERQARYDALGDEEEAPAPLPIAPKPQHGTTAFLQQFSKGQTLNRQQLMRSMGVSDKEIDGMIDKALAEGSIRRRYGGFDGSQVFYELVKKGSTNLSLLSRLIDEELCRSRSVA